MGAWRLSLPHPAATGTLTLRFDLHERVFVSGRYAHEDEKFVLVVPLTCGTNIKNRPRPRTRLLEFGFGPIFGFGEPTPHILVWLRGRGRVRVRRLVASVPKGQESSAGCFNSGEPPTSASRPERASDAVK